MEKKLRVTFYPEDASRVREVAFPRKLAFLLLALLIPLALLGFWLAFAGTLHESDGNRQLRARLALENRALKEKVGRLDQDLARLRGDLEGLEEQKVNALQISGIEYMEDEKKSGSSSLFSFFHNISTIKPDVGASLDKARAVSAYLDSTLETLRRQGPRVDDLPTRYPVAVEAIVTRGFGHSPDPFTGRKALHAGVDFSLRAGAPVRASGAGTVVEAAKDLLWGFCVKLDHGRGVQTFYAHLQDVRVRKGERVGRGQVLGTMGMSGVASGVHLHYELSIRNGKVDPMKFFLPAM